MSREFEKLSKRTRESFDSLKDTVQKTSKVSEHLSQVENEYGRVAILYQNSMQTMNEIDAQFKKVTKLNNLDISFLFLATSMQIVRQYLLTNFPTERLNDKKAAIQTKPTEDKLLKNEFMKNKVIKNEKVNLDEKIDRQHQWYCPTLEEIITNPVPFDANLGSANYGAVKGFGNLGHRGATVGHDPILGLIVGTANIATSTLTNWRFESYHIKSGIYGNLKGTREIISNRASTPLVFSYAFDKLMNQGIKGKGIIGVSLVKEIIHLKSDIGSTKSLPLPTISAISPQLASDLAKRGLDMANAVAIGKQAIYSMFINTLVALIHSLFYYETSEFSRNIYEVKTRKILSYSNVIASTSNLIVTAVTKDLTKLDIGGLLVTLYRVASDTKFINEIKKEFLKNEMYDRIVGTPYDFMEGI